MAKTREKTRRPGRPRTFDEPATTTGFFLPKRLLRSVDSLATAQGVSRNQWVAAVLERAVASRTRRRS